MLGENVRRLREERGWSQAELAERIGVNQTNVSQVERGVLAGRVPKLMALATVFGVTVDDLLRPSAGDNSAVN